MPQKLSNGCRLQRQKKQMSRITTEVVVEISKADALAPLKGLGFLR
ncbi:MAG: hypothetical protein NO515_04435 [Candidatus Methanomethylicia archaeon]|nr:hypothetical protein [Candidatus Methanomethylicia archaeon]